ncbi:hypothetical protein Pmani_012958 [Petrolisthes manimaculis]|uniref:Oplophorus-luciferin 2-monooxygenase non-catalytic subunit n=1 Tax=Petrolisthes manimaculis TaxID=1843537 RepID=A0AAE1PW82_9EUCA|nr:hypothetical protein Pmani_012958 [Petrolisthes manimaculis]
MEGRFIASLLLVLMCEGALVSPTGGLKKSSLVQGLGDVRTKANQCPSEQDIFPCVCIYDSTNDLMDLDCSGVVDEEQLSQVFMANFPSTNFHAFTIYNNTGLTILHAGVFQDVSFQEFHIQFSVLEEIKEDALTPSYTTVTTLALTNNQIFSFPFSQIESFQVLQELNLASNNFHFLQIMKSDTLNTLGLAHNPLSSVTGDIFQGLTAVQIIDLSSTLAAEVFPGVYDSLSTLRQLLFTHNHFSFMPVGSFNLTTGAKQVLLDFTVNNIDTVQVDAFTGLAPGSTINLTDNFLTGLEEAVWRPLLEQDIILILGGNPLGCGCGIAWLVRDETLLDNTRDAMCADGILITDLNPSIFDLCP